MFCTFAHSSLIIWYMLYYIKKYPVSLFIILTVIYLSFFKPPSTEISKIPNIDKVVHICMYFGMSGMLWLRNGGVTARILHDIPWRRLAGFCGQYYGSGACINGRLFHFKAKDEIGL